MIFTVGSPAGAVLKSTRNVKQLKASYAGKAFFADAQQRTLLTVNFQMQPIYYLTAPKRIETLWLTIRRRRKSLVQCFLYTCIRETSLFRMSKYAKASETHNANSRLSVIHSKPKFFVRLTKNNYTAKSTTVLRN